MPHADGPSTRTLLDGLQRHFEASGLHTAVIDRLVRWPGESSTGGLVVVIPWHYHLGQTGELVVESRA